MPKPSQVARVLLVVVNIIFCVLGCIFFAVGLFLRFGSAILDKLIAGVISSLESALSSAGFGETNLSSSFKITDLLLGFAIAFICFGLFLVILTLIGCCGSCLKIKVLLIIYLVVCIILILGQVAVVVIFYRFSYVFEDATKRMLKERIQSSYQGINGTNAVSVGWNVVAQQMKCCGVDNYDDFTGANGWVVRYPSYTLQTPLACCKTLPDSSDFTCAATGGASDNNNYMNTSCHKKIKDLIFGNVFIIAGTLGGLALIQILMILLAILLCISVKRNKVSPREENNNTQSREKTPLKRIMYNHRKNIPPRY